MLPAHNHIVFRWDRALRTVRVLLRSAARLAFDRAEGLVFRGTGDFRPRLQVVASLRGTDAATLAASQCLRALHSCHLRGEDSAFLRASAPSR